MKKRLLPALALVLFLAVPCQAMIGWPLPPRIDPRPPIVTIQPLPVLPQLPSSPQPIIQMLPGAMPGAKPVGGVEALMGKLCLGKVSAPEGLRLYPTADFSGQGVQHHPQGAVLYLHYHGNYCLSEDKQHYINPGDLVLAGAVKARHSGRNLAAPRKSTALAVREFPDMSGRMLVLVPAGREMGECVELTGGITYAKQGFVHSLDIAFGS